MDSSKEAQKQRIQELLDGLNIKANLKTELEKGEIIDCLGKLLAQVPQNVEKELKEALKSTEYREIELLLEDIRHQVKKLKLAHKGLELTKVQELHNELNKMEDEFGRTKEQLSKYTIVQNILCLLAATTNSQDSFGEECQEEANSIFVEFLKKFGIKLIEKVDVEAVSNYVASWAKKVVECIEQILNALCYGLSTAFNIAVTIAEAVANATTAIMNAAADLIRGVGYCIKEALNLLGTIFKLLHKIVDAVQEAIQKIFQAVWTFLCATAELAGQIPSWVWIVIGTASLTGFCVYKFSK